MKGNTLRWLGHIERMGNEEFVKKVYMSESVGPDSRGRTVGGWRDRVKEYMCERGATRGGELDQARREGLDIYVMHYFIYSLLDYYGIGGKNKHNVTCLNIT